MSEPTNLDRFRKRKQREQEARDAALKRAKHGLSKAERDALRRAEERATRQHEGHRVPPSRDPDEPGDAG